MSDSAGLLGKTSRTCGNSTTTLTSNWPAAAILRYRNRWLVFNWSSFFSQVISVEQHGVKQVFVSGQVGVNAQKRLAGEGEFEAQTERAFENLGIALARAGAAWEHVVKLTIYVVGYEAARAMVIGQAIRSRFATGKLPACSLIGVQALAESGFEIEVEAIALVDTENNS